MKCINVKRQTEARIVGIAARKGTSKKSAHMKITVRCAIKGDTGGCPEFRSALRETQRQAFSARKAGKCGENSKEITLQL